MKTIYTQGPWQTYGKGGVEPANSPRYELNDGWIIAAILLTGLVLLSECVIQPAHAGQWYATGSLGATQFTRTVHDGTHIQEGLPFSQTMTGLAYGAGLQYRLSDRWAFDVAYRNFGVAKIRARVVGDEAYWPAVKACISNCTATVQYNTTDLYEGIELTASHYWQLSDSWELFAKLGGAGVYHRLVTQWQGNTWKQEGWIPMSVMGAGVCFDSWLCAESSYYRGFGGGLDWSAGLPISKEFVQGLFTIRIPLS